MLFVLHLITSDDYFHTASLLLDSPIYVLPMSSTKCETVQIPILIVFSKSDVLGSLSFCSGIIPIGFHFEEEIFLLTCTQLSQVLSSAGCYLLVGWAAVFVVL